MAIFGKNKDEDFDENTDLELDKEDKKLTRKFKDLKPENKKKRKEPVKPWGKKERVVVAIILAASILASGILAFSGNVHKVSPANISIPRFDFGPFNLFKEETIIIQK